MRRRLLLTLVAVLALVPAGVHAQDTPPSVGIRLAEAPVGSENDPRAGSYIVDHLAQGSTITRKIEINSTDTKPVDIQLYVAAATVDGGSFQFGEGRAENDLTDWSNVDPPSVTVPPNGVIGATVTIAVPTDAPSGEQYGVVWAELPGSGGTANVVNRVGVRIYLSVGEGNEPASDFKIDALVAKRDADGTPIVETKVTNIGGRAIDLKGTLVLENGPGGLTTQPEAMEVGTTLAPGETAPARVLLDPSLPDGPWDATATITAGRLEHQAKATITFPSEPGEQAKPVAAESTDAEKRKTFIPLAIIALLLAIAAAAFFVFARRRAMKAATAAGKALVS